MNPARLVLGTALLLGMVAGACSGNGQAEPVTLTVAAISGPTCPVQTDPPKPECADRPVTGAVIVIFDDAGDEVARFPTGDDGTFSLDLVPGSYLVEPQPVEGLMGTAFAEHVSLVDRPITLTVKYDTGIR